MVTGAHMLAYKCLVPPTSPLLPANCGGGIDTSSQIFGSLEGEVHFTDFAFGTGGGDKFQTSKYFIKNTHSTDTAYGVKFWGENICDQMAASGTPTATGADSSFTNALTIRWMGFAIGGAAQQANSPGNGTTAVSAQGMFASLSRVEIRDAYDILTIAPCDIFIKLGGITLGKIPAGLSTAIWEFEIGLAATLNDTVTILTPSTLPPVTVSKPRDYASALSAANSGTMIAGAAQGIWSKWSIPERAKPSRRIECPLIIRVLAA